MMPWKTLIRVLACICPISVFSAYGERVIYTKEPFSRQVDAEWAIIGGGPAGICVVSLLLDLGVPPHTIVWIDRDGFEIGRIGAYYQTIPANSPVKEFVEFIRMSATFQEVSSPALDHLLSLDPASYHELKVIIDPLKDITAHLRTKVHTIEGEMKALEFDKDIWNLNVEDVDLTARHVVLATGSHPREMHYDGVATISLDQALDRYALQTLVTPKDCIAVFGSSHSAVLIMKFLCEGDVRRIINFYKHPLIYAEDQGTWILHASSGLRGVAAEWARTVLEQNPPAHLERYLNTDEHRAQYLPECSKAIYAIGYERNSIPLAGAAGTDELSYDPETGIIGPRLFGIGIAFPEKIVDPAGNVEHKVGLNSFMRYAQRVIPEHWLPHDRSILLYRCEALNAFESLFAIDIL